MKLAFLTNFIAGVRAYALVSQKLIAIGVLLIALALTIATTLRMLGRSWFSFILFLIYITGLLVLFSYLISLSPNVHHSAKKCFKAYYFILAPIVFYGVFIFLPKNGINIEKMVINLVTRSLGAFILIALILLFILLIVVSLSYKTADPLRKRLWKGSLKKNI